jgi:hypothetical protein
VVIVSVLYCSYLRRNEYLYGPRSMIEACGIARGECPPCRVVHGERPVIVVSLLYRCAVHRMRRAVVTTAALVGNLGPAGLHQRFGQFDAPPSHFCLS